MSSTIGFRVVCFLTIAGAITGAIGCDRAGRETTDLRITKLERQLEELEHRQLELLSLRKDLDETRARLADTLPPQPITPVEFTLDEASRDDPFLGDEGAPLVLMAFTSFDCQKCNEFAHTTLSELRREFIDAGKVRYLLRDFVLATQIRGGELARMAHCAGEQGGYWRTHDKLIESRVNGDTTLPPPVALKITDTKRFSRCLESERYHRELLEDIQAGKLLGVKGVPTFFLGKRLAGGKYSGVRIRGSQPIGVFRLEIKKLLGNGT